MHQSLFQSIKLLNHKLTDESIDIHEMKNELFHIVNSGRENHKLRIVTQFMNILEVLTKKYEYDDAQSIVYVKSIVKKALDIILSMVGGEISNTSGALSIELLTQEVHALFKQKIGSESFFYDFRLMEQLAFDMEIDIQNTYNILNKPISEQNIQKDFETVNYYFNRIQKNTQFIGMDSLTNLASAVQEFVRKSYLQNHFFDLKNEPDMILALEFFERRSAFIKSHINDYHAIQAHLEEFKPDNLIERLMGDVKGRTVHNSEKADFLFGQVSLTEEEMGALANEDAEFEQISFDQLIEEPAKKSEFSLDDIIPVPANTIPADKKYIPMSVTIDPKEYLSLKQPIVEKKDRNKKYYNLSEHEDTLIKLAGQLFLKQEQLKELLPQEKLVSASSDIKELENLTQNIKAMLFDKYHITMEELLGDELRDFIKSEVQTLNKKIRLGIRGEKSEILTREGQFVKDLVMMLVKNSLHDSLETAARRKALDKSETGWLLIEFEDAGDHFDIYVRDDGRGLVPDLMNIESLRSIIEEKKGILQIDSLENEYLKVRVQLPMRKIIMDSLLVRLGDTFILLPNRCVRQVISPKEVPFALKEEFCLGQVGLSSLLGLEKSSINMFVVCVFGEEKVIFGVDQVLYDMEALIENIDIPLIECCNSVTIIKDGSIGFLINERELYKKSKQLLEKRAEIISANTII